MDTLILDEEEKKELEEKEKKDNADPIKISFKNIQKVILFYN